MATQNPIEMEGTYPLPEAQLDRFLMKILVTLSLARRAEHASSTRTIQKDESHRRSPCSTREDILELRARVPRGSGRPARAGLRDRSGDGHAARQRARRTTRAQVHPLRQLAARRAGAGGMRTVHALLRGRLHLSHRRRSRPWLPAVLRHRIILNFDAHADGQTPETILDKIIPSVSRDASRSGARRYKAWPQAQP